ncbi:MAG: ABC transporter permease subunit [Planctomycetes bacterium]|nr:ABC transporter permease subunit [Planctomycetota bacterium]
MKYLAILKDSLREALDSTVLYVMFALATVIILVVASCSFEPAPADTAMKQFFFDAHRGPMFLAAINMRKPKKLTKEALDSAMDIMVRFRLEKVELLGGEPDAPESKYELTVAEPNAVAAMRANPALEKRDAVADLKSIFADAEDLGYLHVVTVEPLAEGANQFTPRYRVVIQGTSQMHRVWPTRTTLFFGAWTFPESATAPLAMQLFVFAKLVLGFGSWGTVLIGVIITSFFFPNMLRKGTIDLLLARPIHRSLLLVYKYIGGLTFIFLCTAYALLGVWLALGIRTGVWPNGLLLLVVTTTFFFAILYSFSTLIGVVTRSTVTSILLTLGAWVVVFAVGAAHTQFDTLRIVEESSDKGRNPIPDDQRWGDGYWARSLRAGNAILPRTEDLNMLNDMIVYTDFMTGNLTDMRKLSPTDRNWWEALLVSSLWIAFFLGLSCLWISFKDY